MSFGKFRFKDFAEYQSIQTLASENGLTTASEFTKYLETNYSHLKK